MHHSSVKNSHIQAEVILFFLSQKFPHTSRSYPFFKGSLKMIRMPISKPSKTIKSPCLNPLKNKKISEELRQAESEIGRTSLSILTQTEKRKNGKNRNGN
jgi:hypothetical protein